jgi:outer membrane lipase/esterase
MPTTFSSRDEMKIQQHISIVQRSAFFVAAMLLASGHAAAQSVAADFNTIINNISSDCSALTRQQKLTASQSAACNAAAAITPRSDLEMRSAAPEELAAQKSIVREFSAQQMKNIAGRLSDLRTNLAALPADYSSDSYSLAGVSAMKRARGGGASADSQQLASPFNLFVNAAHGFGTRDQTAYEDKLKFHGSELTVGSDYRLTPAFVVGGAIGYSTKRINLSANYVAPSGTTTQNANGKSDVKGVTISVYGQWESGNVYVNGSLGNQWLSHDLQRRADYYSGGAAVPITANASTDSKTLQASLSGGYVWRVGQTSIDAALNAQYQNSKIDGFRETGALCTAGACSGVDLNMRIDGERAKSTETSLSVRVQHAYTPSFGVVVPFISVEIIKQLEDKRYVISGMYESLYGVIPNFSLSTDTPDTQYYAASVGLSLVRPNGWQGFFKYRAKFGLENVSDNLLAAGVRVEF